MEELPGKMYMPSMQSLWMALLILVAPIIPPIQSAIGGHKCTFILGFWACVLDDPIKHEYPFRWEDSQQFLSSCPIVVITSPYLQTDYKFLQPNQKFVDPYLGVPSAEFSSFHLIHSVLLFFYSSSHHKLDTIVDPNHEPDLEIVYCDDLDSFTDFETNFPSIVYNDASTSNQNVSSEPTVSIYNAIKADIDFHISFSDSEDEDYTFIYTKDSSSYKFIPVNDLKLEPVLEHVKINTESCSEDSDVKLVDSVICISKDTIPIEFDKNIKTNHDTPGKSSAKKDFV
ncbi:hypothetical protein Tco_0103507 [Tanacetum coccineum]